MNLQFFPISNTVGVIFVFRCDNHSFSASGWTLVTSWAPELLQIHEEQNLEQLL
jgi:hypothetical protein